MRKKRHADAQNFDVLSRDGEQTAIDVFADASDDLDLREWDRSVRLTALQHATDRASSQQQVRISGQADGLRTTVFCITAPMAVGDMIEICLRIFRARWLSFFAIGVMLVMATLFLNLASHLLFADTLFEPLLFSELNDKQLAHKLTGSVLTSSICYFVLYPLAGAIAQQVVLAQAGGTSVRLKTATHQSLRILPKLAFATVLVWISVAGGLGIFSPLIMVLLSAVRSIVIFEGENPLDAMGRSWMLVRRRVWQYFVARLAALGFLLGACFVAVLLTNIVVVATKNAVDPLIGQIAGMIVFGAIVSFGSTLSPMMSCLIYIDSRMRYEAFEPAANELLWSNR